MCYILQSTFFVLVDFYNPMALYYLVFCITVLALEGCINNKIASTVLSLLRAVINIEPSKASSGALGFVATGGLLWPYLAYTVLLNIW